MKAVTIGADGRTRLRDVDEPVLDTADGVLVRMLEVGVCGTDAGICSGDDGSPPDGADFLVPGHEGLGEVMEVGSDVSDLAAGDLVVPTVRRPCPHDDCRACRSGNQDFCMTGDYTERGIRRAHGFGAELVVEKESYLCRVPSALRDVAVLTEPQSIAEKGLRQYLAIQRRLPWLRHAGPAELLDGCRAVVLGGGPVGLLGCMLLRLYDVPTIVYSRSAPPTEEADLADAVGAQYVSSEESDFEEVVERLGGVDLVYEATGASALMFEVMPHLSANAVFIATGVPEAGGEEEIAADDVMRQLVMKNQVLCGTVNASRGDFGRAIDSLSGMLERWPDAIRGLITHRHGPESFCDSAGSRDGLKHVILPGGQG
ncbi:MAG TPA: alcohol dehydrogenase catalytic domain-containing protein [Longimicrobiales bacterium]|nr:alcohol dehydrogenase catalytic domain-containing protein [Longimicrobiales bacterium]